MAKVVKLLDDIDQSEVDESAGGGTLIFSVDGDYYTIDLGAKNRAAFDKAIQKFVDNATSVEQPQAEAPATRGRAAKRAAAPGRGGSGLSKDELQAVRDWAKGQGIEVAAKGRIAASVIGQYEAAHKR